MRSCSHIVYCLLFWPVSDATALPWSKAGSSLYRSRAFSSHWYDFYSDFGFGFPVFLCWKKRSKRKSVNRFFGTPFLARGSRFTSTKILYLNFRFCNMFSTQQSTTNSDLKPESKFVQRLAKDIELSAKCLQLYSLGGNRDRLLVDEWLGSRFGFGSGFVVFLCVEKYVSKSEISM